jgi:hypothetical protein
MLKLHDWFNALMSSPEVTFEYPLPRRYREPIPKIPTNPSFSTDIIIQTIETPNYKISNIFRGISHPFELIFEEYLSIGIGGPPLPPNSPPVTPRDSSEDNFSDKEPLGNHSPSPKRDMAKANANPPWLSQDAFVVSRDIHPLPKNPKKNLPRFDPHTKDSADSHIKKFMFVVIPLHF